MAQVLPAQAEVPRKLHYEQVAETKHERKRQGLSKVVKSLIQLNSRLGRLSDSRSV